VDWKLFRKKRCAKLMKTRRLSNCVSTLRFSTSMIYRSPNSQSPRKLSPKRSSSGLTRSIRKTARSTYSPCRSQVTWRLKPRKHQQVRPTCLVSNFLLSMWVPRYRQLLQSATTQFWLPTFKTKTAQPWPLIKSFTLDCIQVLRISQLDLSLGLE
jgi:hypothetical protein